MAEPVTFTSATPRFSLPYLFAAQAQKEFFVNQAHARTDAIMHAVVLGTAPSPPANPNDGECWIVASSGQSEWAGKDDALACYVAGSWLFVSPVPGMQAYDQSAGRRCFFDGGWATATDAQLPEGGATIDAEARSAIQQIIDALKQIGVFSSI